jgi:hypothetical protein
MRRLGGAPPVVKGKIVTAAYSLLQGVILLLSMNWVDRPEAERLAREQFFD